MRETFHTLTMLGLLLMAPAAAGTQDAEAPARERLDALQREVPRPEDQAALLVRLGFLLEDDPELAAAARERLGFQVGPLERAQAPRARLGGFTGSQVIGPLRRAFDTGSLEQRREIIVFAAQVYLEIKGTSSTYIGLIKDALESPDAAIRRAGLDQVASYRVQRVALPVADLYYRYPEDRLLALDVLGQLANRRGIDPAMDALRSDEAALRQAGVRCLARIARPAAVSLKELMRDDDARLAKDAGRALLGFAGTEDLPALYEFAERFAATDEELGRRLTRAIAEIEVGTYRPPALEEL